MALRLDRITVRDFKRIETLELDLKPVTALVGGNTSGKSSALQAAQLGISVLQAAYRRALADGRGDFLGTVSNDAVVFRPIANLLELRRLPLHSEAGVLNPLRLHGHGDRRGDLRFS